MSALSALPTLPAKAAYLFFNNPTRRNALSLAVLRDLQSQLKAALTSPATGELLLLPKFNPDIIVNLEGNDPAYTWLLDGATWREQRKGLPNVIVLRSSGPVFCSGHDLKELANLSHDEVKETFATCAEVMRLIRHSPAPVVCGMQGLASAAGLQLALSADYTIAHSATLVQLPGASIGLPCTSPATAVGRALGSRVTYRMLATASSLPVSKFRDAIDIVRCESAYAMAQVEKRIAEVVRQIAGGAGQPTALGKWAYWTQLGITGTGGDGYEEAAEWAGRVMALHARSEDAKEGIKAFLEKRPAQWTT